MELTTLQIIVEGLISVQEARTQDLQNLRRQMQDYTQTKMEILQLTMESRFQILTSENGQFAQRNYDLQLEIESTALEVKRITVDLQSA